MSGFLCKNVVNIFFCANNQLQKIKKYSKIFPRLYLIAYNLICCFK